MEDVTYSATSGPGGGARSNGSGERSLSGRLDELGLQPWDALVLLATVFLAVVMPLEAVFPAMNPPWLMAISATISVLIGIDIRRRLASGEHRYLRGWFTLDLLAAIPFDLLADAPGIAGTGAASILRLMALVRGLRVLRLFALQRRWRIRTSFNPAVVRLAFFAFWIVLISHWMASGWIALDGFESGPPDLPPYQSALYWAITTLTTVGYGDITPVGVAQTYYTMAAMALGAAMYGYIIGNVASLLANLDVIRSRHLRRVETVNHFMRDRHVPRPIQARVRDYYDYVWESRIGQEAEILNDLPKPLHVEIALHLRRTILERVPLFSGADDAFLRELVLHLKAVVFLPGQLVMKRGEVGHELYFIDHGSMEVLAPDDRSVLAVLGDGDFVGEMALLADQPRANTVIATDYCNVYSLGRDAFNRVLASFPDVATEVQRVAEARRLESSTGE